MWAVFRKYRKTARKAFVVFFIFLMIIQLKTPSMYYFTKKFVKLRAQFSGLNDYLPVFDFLTSINVTVVALDPNMLTFGEVNEKFVTFGIFENDVYLIRKAAAARAVPYFWLYREHKEVDFRKLNITRTKTNVTAHFSFTSQVGTLHLAVIFSRSDYFWISDFTDHNFNSNLSITLPMAVQRFSCRYFAVSDYHRFCIPAERGHYLWQLQYSRFLECHYEDIVWKFEKDYPLEKVDTTPHADSLREMMRIGNKFEVPIMLAYGTLLGWYRQCDYIVHSRDIDTTMFITDFSHELFRELWFSKVLRIYVRLGTMEEGLEFRSYGANTVWFDLFMMYPYGDSYFTYMIHTILLELHRSKYPLPTEICSADLLGVLVRLPCDPLKYILTEYGQGNWYTPGNYHYYNIEVVGRYNNTAEMMSNIHTYTESCSDPSVLWGCDQEGQTGMPGFG